MSYFQQHIFLCTNQKALGKTCCANTGGELFFDHLKTRLLELELFGPEKIRVSKSGCLGRCALGPCMVIYPEGLWYTYQSVEDIDTIVQDYLIDRKIVSRLLIP